MNRSHNDVIVKGVIPNDIADDSILTILTNNVTAYTHGFHKYPAKFIPHIPRWAIDKHLASQGGNVVFDPFCGSGTTLVEGLLAGHNAIGFDIDPLSCFISKVKTTPIDIATLELVCEWIMRGIKRRKNGRFIPECETIEHWFTTDAIRKLSLIRTLIDEIPEKFGNASKIKDIQDLLLLCFSSIIRRVSNADNESQKTYVSHTNIKEPEEVFGLFSLQLNLFKERSALFSKSVRRGLTAEVICATSVDSLSHRLGGTKPDLVITSPPYIKAIDYIYNQMVELFWIGDLFGMQTQTLQNAKKADYIGTKHLPAKIFADYSPYTTTLGIPRLDEKVQKVFSTDKKNGHKHSFVTDRYFSEMERHLSEMSICLNPQSHYVLVVGNSSVSNIHFETADFLIELAQRNGFHLTGRWGYRIRNRYMRFDRKGRGGTIEIDWVLDFVRT